MLLIFQQNVYARVTRVASLSIEAGYGGNPDCFYTCFSKSRDIQTHYALWSPIALEMKDVKRPEHLIISPQPMTLRHYGSFVKTSKKLITKKNTKKRQHSRPRSVFLKPSMTIVRSRNKGVSGYFLERVLQCMMMIITLF